MKGNSTVRLLLILLAAFFVLCIVMDTVMFIRVLAERKNLEEKQAELTKRLARLDFLLGFMMNQTEGNKSTTIESYLVSFLSKINKVEGLNVASYSYLPVGQDHNVVLTVKGTGEGIRALLKEIGSEKNLIITGCRLAVPNEYEATISLFHTKVQVKALQAYIRNAMTKKKSDMILTKTWDANFLNFLVNPADINREKPVQKTVTPPPVKNTPPVVKKNPDTTTFVCIGTQLQNDKLIYIVKNVKTGEFLYITGEMITERTATRITFTVNGADYSTEVPKQ